MRIYYKHDVLHPATAVRLYRPEGKEHLSVNRQLKREQLEGLGLPRHNVSDYVFMFQGTTTVTVDKVIADKLLATYPDLSVYNAKEGKTSDMDADLKKLKHIELTKKFPEYNLLAASLGFEKKPYPFKSDELRQGIIEFRRSGVVIPEDWDVVQEWQRKKCEEVKRLRSLEVEKLEEKSEEGNPL